jgi:DNA polymerase-1
MAAAKDAYEKERSASKAITFGLMYGKTIATLARELGVPYVAAERIVNAILGGYSGFDAWCKAQQAHGRQHGESWTWWDGSNRWRRRPLWEIGDAQDQGRQTARSITAMNSTINSPIQGTAADYCMSSTIELVKLARAGELGRDTKVVLTIHDAVVFESREENVLQLVKTAKACMLQWATPAGVPFGVDAKVGRTLGELKGYHA